MSRNLYSVLPLEQTDLTAIIKTFEGLSDAYLEKIATAAEVVLRERTYNSNFPESQL